jgi:hypothetical protein
VLTAAAAARRVADWCWLLLAPASLWQVQQLQQLLKTLTPLLLLQLLPWLPQMDQMQLLLLCLTALLYMLLTQCLQAPDCCCCCCMSHLRKTAHLATHQLAVVSPHPAAGTAHKPAAYLSHMGCWALSWCCLPLQAPALQ